MLKECCLYKRSIHMKCDEIGCAIFPPWQSISGVTSPVQSVSFNYSENWVGAGSKSGVIKVFDLDENKSQLLYWPNHTAWQKMCGVKFHMMHCCIKDFYS